MCPAGCPSAQRRSAQPVVAGLAAAQRPARARRRRNRAGRRQITPKSRAATCTRATGSSSPNAPRRHDGGAAPPGRHAVPVSALPRTRAVIEVRDLTRTYHVGDVDVLALRGVDLTIERGEFVAIMGSSGSGKSTLMAILGCLDRPTGGHYLFEGVDVAGVARAGARGHPQRKARLRLPELQSAGAHQRDRECRTAADLCARPRRPGRNGDAGARVPELFWAWPTASATRPASFPAASSSASPSRAR